MDSDRTWTPFHRAARNGNLEELRRLLREGADVDSRNNRGETALHIASIWGRVEAVRELLSGHGRAANANLQEGVDGLTPLHMAVHCGHAAVVRALIREGGAVLDLRSNLGETPLHEAVSEGVSLRGQVLVDVVRGLLSVESGRAVVDAVDDYGCTALHYAAKKGRIEAGRLLLAEGGASPMVVGINGITALHLAAAFGHLAFVQLLLENGAAIDAKDGGGWTPLTFAVRNGQHGTVDLLLANGASVDVVSRHGYMPIHYAARGARRPELSEYGEPTGNYREAEPDVGLISLLLLKTGSIITLAQNAVAAHRRRCRLYDHALAQAKPGSAVLSALADTLAGLNAAAQDTLVGKLKSLAEDGTLQKGTLRTGAAASASGRRSSKRRRDALERS